MVADPTSASLLLEEAKRLVEEQGKRAIINTTSVTAYRGSPQLEGVAPSWSVVNG